MVSKIENQKAPVRKSAFANWLSDESEQAAQIPTQSDEMHHVPPSPLDLIPKVEKKKRNRDFEHRNRTYTYRLSDKELGGKVANVARLLHVVVDEVARAFVEAALEEVNKGNIPFNAVPPNQSRLTLYPTGEETWKIQEQSGWSKDIPKSTRKRGKPLTETEKRNREKERNQTVVTYRWPADVNQKIVLVTEKIFGKALTRSEGRKGWVLTILLRAGLNAYETGKLPLRPQPIVTDKKELKWS